MRRALPADPHQVPAAGALAQRGGRLGLPRAQRGQQGPQEAAVRLLEHRRLLRLRLRGRRRRGADEHGAGAADEPGGASVDAGEGGEGGGWVGGDGGCREEGWAGPACSMEANMSVRQEPQGDSLVACSAEVHRLRDVRAPEDGLGRGLGLQASGRRIIGIGLSVAALASVYGAD